MALAVNINRRHLKASARHMIAEMARRLANKNAKNGVSKKDAAEAAGLSGVGRMVEAGVVLGFAPAVVCCDSLSNVQYPPFRVADKP